MSERFKAMETKLVHAGEPEPRLAGAVVAPIFQTANYEFAGEASYHDIRYMRLNNSPNHIALGRKLAAVEGAEAAVVTGSGMAAISTALLTVLGGGDHLLVQDSLYGGTNSLLTVDFPALGIEHDFVDAAEPDSWRARLRPNTRAFYVETITNPTIRVGDLQAVVSFAREHGLTKLIDNTFASPVNLRPIEHGFDLSLHSCTKYLNGHSDIVAGAVVGSSELVGRVTNKLDHLGGCLDTHACFLLNRGMKTLALRVRRQNESALKLARFLEGHRRVERVNYPGLASSTSHERAARLLDGFGGMLSFELSGGVQAAERFQKRVRIAVVAASLGGPETLVTIPATTSHAGLSPAERERAGVPDSLVRISVGIEDADELIEDFRQAME